MQLSGRFYATFWLSFFSCVLIPRWMGAAIGLPVHIFLGVMILVATFSNDRRLAVLPAPLRIKRISKTTMGFAVFQVICGFALGAVMHFVPDIPYVAPILRSIHIVSALSILTKSSSMATVYDMWEEKGFVANGTGQNN